MEVSKTEFQKLGDKGILVTNISGERYIILDGILIRESITKEEAEKETENKI